MNINELLDTIDEGLRDIQQEILENLGAKAKAQRTKPLEVRLNDLEILVSRMKWEVSGLRSRMKVIDMRLERAASSQEATHRKETTPRKRR